MAAASGTASAAAAVRKAYALLEEGDLRGALPLLEVGIGAYPSNLSLHVNYANCLADDGVLRREP
jgi:hypothetical protein